MCFVNSDTPQVLFTRSLSYAVKTAIARPLQDISGSLKMGFCKNLVVRSGPGIPACILPTGGQKTDLPLTSPTTQQHQIFYAHYRLMMNEKTNQEKISCFENYLAKLRPTLLNRIQTIMSEVNWESIYEQWILKATNIIFKTKPSKPSN